ncbi:MAG: hypothetical protein WCT40_02585 [Candidatus Magasanikbacteria bacterium]|jgi:2-phosphoglycerate kinase
MIYLIGAPPRCGKTTLAKKMSIQTKIPWLSCDTLDSIAQEYTPAEQWAKKFPYSHLRRTTKPRSNDIFYQKNSPAKIIRLLKQQARSVWPAMETAIACKIADGNDYIIEGYHITPDFAGRMIKKFGKDKIRAVFLGKTDAKKFAIDAHKSTTPNDWLLVLTKKPETFLLVGKMVADFSRLIEKESAKNGLKCFKTDQDFEITIDQAIKHLLG